MEFLDLSDNIEADEWLIESDRIAYRRLVKQTPRFNIYKADYFGDSNVLVYEPVNNCTSSRVANSQQLCNDQQQEYLRDRLSRLDLNLDETTSPTTPSQTPLSPCISCTSSDGDQTIDSAYSSTSSTPQYYTKTEFRYPVCASPSYKLYEVKQTTAIQTSITSTVEREQTSRKPVVLNKDSFGRQEVSRRDNASATEHSFWFELNELRLVAHENFMLFMGASMAQDQQLAAAQCLPTLVMEMNHPKAVSFYNLLHNWRWTNMSDSLHIRCSPLKLKRPQLSYGAKLNICQQVTNAMAYLHARNIVHGKLTSVNIYMELNRRIKISLLDDDERALATRSTCDCDKQQTVEFNLPSLTYLSPELIQTISIVNNGVTPATMKVCENYESICDNQTPVQIDANQLTKESDIFSFGTFLFELFEERYPFAADNTGCTRLRSQTTWNGNIKQSANELIYQIGSGQMASRNLDSFMEPIEMIIAQCWSQKPSFRPEFKQLAAMFK